MISSKDFVGALEKGLQVITAFDTASSRLSSSDVATKLGITRAAARRFLLTLVELEYAELDGRHFSITPKVLHLSRAHLVGNPVFRVTQQVLESIASETEESASLGVLTGSDILFVARAASPRPVSISIAVGTKFPAHRTAMGRVLLAEMPDARLLKLLSSSSDSNSAKYTKAQINEVVSGVRRVRAQGYATNIGELEMGLNAIAVPVRNSAGEATMAIGLSVPASRKSREQMITDFLPRLGAGAAELSSFH